MRSDLNAVEYGLKYWKTNEMFDQTMLHQFGNSLNHILRKEFAQRFTKEPMASGEALDLFPGIQVVDLL